MIVKLKELDDILGIPKGFEFEVVHQDDGFYTDHPFYQGWVINSKGDKFYATYDKEKCEIVNR